MDWQVRIAGNEYDSKVLLENFQSHLGGSVKFEEGFGYVYRSNRFHGLGSAEEVGKVADEDLELLSGILKLDHRARTSLSWDVIFYQAESGGRVMFTYKRDEISLRDDLSLESDKRGNTLLNESTRSMAIFELSLAESTVAKALRLLNRQDIYSWVGLYRLYEVVVGDLRNSPDIIARGWSSKVDKDRFTRSANSIEVAGDESRHGKEEATAPSKSMSLPEADVHIRKIVHAWLDSKLSQIA